jgi:hypothetical protein
VTNRACLVCGGPVHPNSAAGICTRTPGCLAAREAAGLRDNRSCPAAATPAERQLAAERAGLPCPCCGRVIGGNGICWASQSCIDDGLRRLLGARYNPAALYDQQVTGQLNEARSEASKKAAATRNQKRLSVTQVKL